MPTNQNINLATFLHLTKIYNIFCSLDFHLNLHMLKESHQFRIVDSQKHIVLS